MLIRREGDGLPNRLSALLRQASAIRRDASSHIEIWIEEDRRASNEDIAHFAVGVLVDGLPPANQ
jgi:hypothetical protein